MAKIDNGKVAMYKGRYPLNMATKTDLHISKKAGEALTAAEVAAIPDDTFASMVKRGNILVTDKPKAPVKGDDK